MKVGDLVKLTRYGKENTSSFFHKAKYGIILSAEMIERTYGRGIYRPTETYRVRWFDSQGSPMKACVYNFPFMMLETLNKTNN